MVNTTMVVLDVLKPIEPNVITFAHQVAKANTGCLVNLIVKELDKATETLIIRITGESLDIDAIKETLKNAGASLHSIDEVEVKNLAETTRG